MIRLGEFLKKGHNSIHSLDATEISVILIVETLKSREEILDDVKACKLLFTRD
ncbi:uncharacterized protein CTRU02_214314 [Colletotrichum truncatum]|uniref:Uncharacterized protein n=1 Tax=Colletotrichum truncatum TaxID=5467 RepID=A0ACC3YI59_COLTU|nr:uncharacterized protein CTRU02_11389 [Colletotrichum truncatum]KAF6786131.1 hypothetical protein CTRU02_11389 [Colletotrichum truncatum]